MILMDVPEEDTRLANRNGLIWRDYCRGVTQEELARRHGISQPRVSKIIAQVRDSIPEDDRQAEVTRSLETLRSLRDGALQIWDSAPAPVFVGKDGDPAQDPDTLEYVRDHSGRLAALVTALKVDKEIRTLLGLDAASKLDVNVNAKEEEAAEQLAQDAARRLAGTDDTKELE